MKLDELLHSAALGENLLERSNETSERIPDVQRTVLDSRHIQPGDLFVALQGVATPMRPALDGHEFIAQARRLGAVAVVGSRPFIEVEAALAGLPYVQVRDGRKALAALAAAIHGFPARRLKLVGVTGTKGKTTTSVLIHHLLEHAGLSVGRLSTVGARWPGHERALSGHFTTPEANELQGFLSEFVQAGCELAVLEVSSHALAMERVGGLDFELGVWTNLSADHLDLHGDLETYALEKRKLIERSKFSVLNADDERYALFAIGSHWSYGCRRGDWWVRTVRESAGLDLEIEGPQGDFTTTVPLIGEFNAYNVLAASAAVAHLGLELPEIARGLASFPGVPGRMQCIQTRPFAVFNDFAHNGVSLEAACRALRQFTERRLIVVVGTTGLQDPDRYANLGRVAAQQADLTVFTEDDTRSEDLPSILQALSNAARSYGGHFLVEPDRRAAIRLAIREARVGDTVLLAGKGHERTLQRSEEVIPWDETLEARRVLAELGLHE